MFAKSANTPRVQTDQAQSGAFHHALVIGGTGMLRGVCVELSRRGTALSLIARTRASLNRTRLACPRPDAVLMCEADYADDAALDRALDRAIAAQCTVDLLIAWIHSHAREALPRVLKRVRDDVNPVLVVHVCGSQTADPLRATDPFAHALVSDRGIVYCRVMLGFLIESGGSRWLTDSQIVLGVLSAIDHRAPTTVVGTVTPWNARP